MPVASPMVGAPCWIDLFSSDPEKATHFYGELFGWTPQQGDPRFGGYFTYKKDEGDVAGCMKNDGSHGMPDVWTIYLMAPDAGSVANLAAGSGGGVEIAPMVVAEHGTMAVVTDPGQARIGVWQPGSMHGFDMIGEHGTPYWFELHTQEYDASVAFYRSVFGWDAHAMSDTPDFRYTTLGLGESQRAGIMDASAFMPEGAPAAWSVYFGVDAIDPALEQVVALGGAVVDPVQETPYGRLVGITDPTGTRLKLAGRS